MKRFGVCRGGSDGARYSSGDEGFPLDAALRMPSNVSYQHEKVSRAGSVFLVKDEVPPRAIIRQPDLGQR
jgi:hypothetical protein